MNERKRRRYTLVFASTAIVLTLACRPAQRYNTASPILPANIKAIFDKPIYHGATWGLRVVDLTSGQALIDTEADHKFFIGSVRKLFTVGQLMNQVGPTHTYDTPVYRRGEVDSAGVLHGDLILIASGDLTMGGRTNPNGSIAYGDFDHNEANSLGNSDITKPDPLAGYASLAQQVAASGIKQITGNIIIDDRLFQPWNFRNEFNLSPIFVNDDLIDLTINPTQPGKLAAVEYRPHSAALRVDNTLHTTASGTSDDIKLTPELPACIGNPACTATISGDIPVNYIPPMTGKYPLIRSFRITEPASYARTVFIEKLQAAGVQIKSPTVSPNPAQLLPDKTAYTPDMHIAQLRGMTYAEDAKLIMKVSYNIGADTSLLLFGLTQGVDNMTAALAAESKNLETNYGINPSTYVAIDGSGGGDTSALDATVTHFLANMATRPAFAQFEAALPILGVDGSLATVTSFTSDPTLALAKGQVHAKTGTYLTGTETGLVLKGQALGGYITTKNGRKLAYELVVNNVPVKNLPDVIQVFQDQGTISAILWRDN